jgi:phage baseplate assembly protein W
MTNLQANDEDIRLLDATRWLMEHIQGLLQNKRPPLGSRLIDLIQTIDAMSRGWQSRLKEVGDEAILTRWDNSIRKSGLTFRIMKP